MIRTATRFFGLFLTSTLFLTACASKPSPRNAAARATSYSPPVAAATPNAAAPNYTQASFPAEPEVASGNGSSAYDAPSIYAESAILLDARTGRVLWSKNADQLRPVASTQKLLTALMIVERGNLSQRVTIAPQDTHVEPTKLGVSPGEQYARETLLACLMVKSCNDAACALARDHSGSVEAFCMAMNRKAVELGARNSNFRNPHGLPDPGQYSTARDVARFAFVAYRSPTLRRLMRTQNYSVTLGSGRVRHLEATNKLLGRSSIYNGMKTGYTNAAGRCLVSSASYNGRDVILVQLGSKTTYIFDDAERMMQWGLRAETAPTFASASLSEGTAY